MPNEAPSRKINISKVLPKVKANFDFIDELLSEYKRGPSIFYEWIFLLEMDFLSLKQNILSI